MNYCLIYGTSETDDGYPRPRVLVNYYLVCGTSETGKHFAAGGDQVNYCLVCGTSETMARNGCWQVRGELLLELRYLRNRLQRPHLQR